jgi:hypothetical protein
MQMQIEVGTLGMKKTRAEVCVAYVCSGRATATAAATAPRLCLGFGVGCADSGRTTLGSGACWEFKGGSAGGCGWQQGSGREGARCRRDGWMDGGRDGWMGGWRDGGRDDLPAECWMM